MKLIFSMLLAALMAAPNTTFGAPDKADFERSVHLRENWKALTRNIVFPVDWLDGSHEFVYRKTIAGGIGFFIQNADSGEERPAFDQQKIADALGDALGEDIAPKQLPFDHFTFTDDHRKIEFLLHYRPWQCDIDGSKCTKAEIAKDEQEQPKAFGVVRDLRVDIDANVVPSADGNYLARVKAYNVVITTKDGTPVFRTTDGTADNRYDITSAKWSPDNTALVVVKFQPGEANFVTRVLAAPPDQLQPKLNKQLYPKPGDRVDIDQPVMIEVEAKKLYEIDNSLYPNPYTLKAFNWRDDSQSFTFHYTERGLQRERIIEVNRATAAPSVVIDETAETFVYNWNSFYHDVNNAGKELIWLSERDGWAHLYLYDGKSGKVKQQITKGQWPVRDVLKVDDKRRHIYFAASGMNAGEDPYFVHYYRINFDGSGLTPLTVPKADHTIAFSTDKKYYVDVYSRVDLPNIAELRRTHDGSLVRTIAKGDISKLIEAGFHSPEPFVAKGRDGKTDIWGLVVKPQNFDADKTYPVIENIYAGPHDSFVPKSFWPFGYHSGGDKVIGMQALADLGFIVVQIDGMGTANRSKAFHDVAWKNLGDSGFPDRILWHKAAAKQFPWYDISAGVGIYGASAGGQSTVGALVFHPDFYSVGVAYAGCYDNRMDKISWNEQWMGYPVGPEYAASSGTEHADNLQGKLFIINGEQDSNVDPASTMQLVDALIKADKNFDLLVVPGGEHTVGRSTGPIDYIQRRQFAFFVENLQKQPLPDWNQKD